MIISYKSIQTRTARHFGLILLGLLIIFLGIHFFRFHAVNGLLLFFVFFVILLLLLPSFVIRALFWGVLFITAFIGTILTFMLLSLIFFLIILPLGLIRRLVGRSPLDDTLHVDEETYWSNIEEDDNDFTKQY
ncbi:MAG: hypothetical protein PHS99_01945 [Candidatus Marinimicrobia bacterium]|nr:hypothetical protein [Candidatus Neomarinimicrobiota bacterium]